MSTEVQPPRAARPEPTPHRADSRPGSRGLIGGWRVAIRIARREARRAKRRTLLMLVTIMLPVLAVSATAVVLKTAEISSLEGLDSRLGAADARIVVEDGVTDVEHGVDPDQAGGWSEQQGGERADLGQVLAALGRDVPTAELREFEVKAKVADGVVVVGAIEFDPADPLTEGLATLTSGRWPSAAGEVTITEPLLDEGVAVGDELPLVGPENEALSSVRVVGVARDPRSRTWPRAIGLPGTLAAATTKQSSSLDRTSTWLVGGGPVAWEDVRALNAIGGWVLSRAVVEDPPAEAAAYGSEDDDALMAVIGLVVAMVLIEVVLLAGPAFAVGARKQARTIALVVAAGGTPAQARRIVLGTAVVIGGLASLVGIVGGLAVGAGVLPIAQRWSGEWFGPFDPPWLLLGGVAGFGLAAALLAAAVPAWIASRQDVVAVLAGRRGDRPPSLRSPILGLVLLGLGVAGAAASSRASSGGEAQIAGAAILAVLGMVLLVPVVVVVLARLGAGLPLPLRYAVRDAARHRSRTVPAVAAVAATVVGVVALGIAAASDEAENAETYTLSQPLESGLVTITDNMTGEPSVGADDDWTAVQAAIAARLPGAALQQIDGVVLSEEADSEGFEIEIATPAGAAVLESYGGALPAGILVGETLPTSLVGISADDRARADRALAAGGAVGISDAAVGGDRGEVTLTRYSYDDVSEETTQETRMKAPVAVVRPAPGTAPASSVLSPKLASALGLRFEQVGLSLAAPVDAAAERDLKTRLKGVTPDAHLSVERGYQRGPEATLILVVLAGLGAVLMLAGTLTATSLALSDAQPDLATLAAVGAAPRSRRSIAAAYALVIGVVGSVLGAAVGFVPGWAVTYPLTGDSWRPEASGLPDHFVDIPWLLIGAVVIGLPLVTAAVAGLTTRSRLPMVARID